ncbi:hypothetical protein JVT61DRAFT_7650 [Boletus reticuloceps]|uniref:F-box domain-containing protein n=1 Tax=Boletus reticuloceps TaxID=495285 RepID=A0A8I3A607_9AGAM|nr:hypothetical protein JVT61DRAFT_7650 [Boletus reticuloceps]
MHHCLHISEVLSLIFQFIRHSHNPRYRRPSVAKKTLVSLARTCHLFSSPALDALWHDLDSFDPLLKKFPIAACSVDDPQWSTFRKYAERVKIFRGHEAHVPEQVKEEFIYSLQDCPESCLPLLPNIIELEWSELPFSAFEDSGISLLRYFVGPTVTTITLSLVHWLAYTPVELAVLADLPKLCPNVTSLSILPCLSRDYEPSREVGRMVTQWPRLRSLRMCAVAQPVMEQLFSRRTLESLHIDYLKLSPVYVGRIPDTVYEFTLAAASLSLGTRFLETAHASPTKARLLIGMHEGQEEDVEKTCQLLPHHLDTSRLLSLTIQPTSSTMGIPTWRTLRLRGPLVLVLVEFRALRELDLDSLCMAQMSDDDYVCLAGSLTQLRSLKLGTANPSIMRPRPAASVGAVIAVLRCCQHLETLHVVFDGSMSPPGRSTTPDSKAALSDLPLRQGWGVSNRHITKLCVGYSPIGDATINAIACCFKSIMPCLAKIECIAWVEEWRLVQNILRSYDDGQIGWCGPDSI